MAWEHGNGCGDRDAVVRARPTADSRGLIVRISFRTSSKVGGRPGRPWRTFQVLYSRKPLQCQPITVSGLTMTKADRQSLQAPLSHAHRSRSADVSLGRFTERRSTPSWCRSAPSAKQRT